MVHEVIGELVFIMRSYTYKPEKGRFRGWLKTVTHNLMAKLKRDSKRVLFDIEAALILPWGTIVRQVGTAGLIAVGTFVGVLMLGWAWAIRKGALGWV